MIQAGMAAECGARLAAAVSNAGALGSIGSIGAPPAQLAAEIAACRAATSRPFAVNVVTFDWAFQHLYTVDDQLACLARARRHLAPGGRFAFDVLNPDLARIALPEEAESEEDRFRDGDDEIVRLVTIRRDVAAQVQDVAIRFERRRDGVAVGSEIERFRMRWFHRFELEHLLARAGFAVVALHGDFDRRPFDRDAREIIVVAISR